MEGAHLDGCPGVAVVVPHHGDPGPTTHLVRLLAEQRYPGPLDVVVVDDASPTPMPGVEGARVVRTATNSGFGTAVNRGVDAAEPHPLLLVLNSDCEPGPDFVRGLVVAARPHLPAVCGVTVLSDPPVPPAGRFPTVRGVLVPRVAALRRPLARSAWLRRLLLDPPVPADRPAAADWVSGVALLLPRSAFVDVGGFDERFFMYWEDVDLQVRLREHGVRAVPLAGVTLEHAGGASSTTEQRRAWGLASEVRYFAHRGAGPRHVLGYRAVLCANLGYDVLRRAAGRPVRPLVTFREERARLRDARAALTAR